MIHPQSSPRKRWRQPDAKTVVILVALLVSMTSLAAWITHVVVTVKAGAWAFLIAGAIAFPVAVVHGIGIWLGVW